MDLILPLKSEYFEQIKAGTKTEEYRLCTPYWNRRIEGRQFDLIILTLGYPKKDDCKRRLIMPYRGYYKKLLVHPHFGDDPVEVYAIHVAQNPA